MTNQPTIKGEKSISQHLKFGDIDLGKSFFKSLYYTHILKEKNVVFHFLKLQATFARAIVKLFSLKDGTSSKTNIPKNKVVVQINSIQQIQFWLKTIRQFPSDTICFLYDRKTISDTAELENYCRTENLHLFIVDIQEYYRCEKLKYFTSIFKVYFKILFNKGAMHYKPIALQFYANSIIAINYTSNFYNLIKPRAVLVLADEVNPFSTIFTQILHKCGGKVINSMNGIKSEDPRNSDTDFDAWLIWSQSQYKMLTELNKTPKEQLFITGHLHADTIHNFMSEEKPPIPFSVDGYDKIIAVFSQPNVGGYEKNRQEFLNEINLFFSEHKNYLGIVKPHPRERKEDFEDLLDIQLPNIRYVDDSSTDKHLLYSIIAISDCMVLMYSTVAIEGLFFSKPVFSFCTKGINDPLAISEKLIPRFKSSKELLHLIESKIKAEHSSDDEITYEIGWRDGLNHKRAAEVIQSIVEDVLK